MEPQAVHHGVSVGCRCLDHHHATSRCPALYSSQGGSRRPFTTAYLSAADASIAITPPPGVRLKTQARVRPRGPSLTSDARRCNSHRGSGLGARHVDPVHMAVALVVLAQQILAVV